MPRSTFIKLVEDSWYLRVTPLKSVPCVTVHTSQHAVAIKTRSEEKRLLFALAKAHGYVLAPAQPKEKP